MASHIGAALIGELTGRAISKVLTTLGDRSGVDKKLRRLKILVIKLRSTVEVSEKLGTETASLLEWRDKLKEAAAEGKQALLSFQQRATPTPEDDAAAEATKGHHPPSESTFGAASVTRNAFQGVARGVRNAAALLLVGGEGTGNLNNTLDRLEKVCADVGDFISLLQAEASIVKSVHKPNKRKRMGMSKCRALITEDIMSVKWVSEEPAMIERARSTAMERLKDASTTEEDELTEEAAMSAAVKRLNDALAEITRAVEMADGRDLSGLECLAEWARVLRETKAQGHAIVSDTEACKQAEEGQDEDQLWSAVESMENLALDVGWFTSLVSLCTPTK